MELELFIGTKTYTVESAPPGLLLLVTGSLIMKSEYRKDNQECECYIVSSGEYYCGSQQTNCTLVIIE